MTGALGRRDNFDPFDLPGWAFWLLIVIFGLMAASHVVFPLMILAGD